MRRRSRREARRAESIFGVQGCMFFGCLVLVSVVLPGALMAGGRSRHQRVNEAGASLRADASSGIKWERHPHAEEWIVPEPFEGIAHEIPSVPRSKDDIHIAFSTDCSPYQNFQSLALFYTAEVVEQKGPVTRIASGCTEEEQRELRQVMAAQPERFRVHFTPDYSKDPVTGERFLFYNKPNGMAHFLKNADPPISEAVVALLDPDMLLMSPLTPYVGDPNAMLWHEAEFALDSLWVEEGKPVGQYYGLGGQWAVWADLPDITASLGADTPARKVPPKAAAALYSVGPPYLMHPRDWARSIDLWVSMSPEVYRRHPGILAEMYGFCIAAAHVRLEHRIAYGLMVSDSSMGTREGWPLVDPLGRRACDPVAVDKQRPLLPPVIHYCQFYRVGTFMFGKRHKTHHTFFSCAADAHELPPPDYLGGPMATLRVQPERRGGDGAVSRGGDEMPLVKGIRQGYAMCSVLRVMNAAQASYKNRYCSPQEISGGFKRLTDLSPSRIAEYS